MGRVLALRRSGLEPEAERTILERIDKLRAAQVQVLEQRNELRRQFVQGDLHVAAGARAGLPLTSRGRAARVDRLLRLDRMSQDLRDREVALWRILGRPPRDPALL